MIRPYVTTVACLTALAWPAVLSVRAADYPIPAAKRDHWAWKPPLSSPIPAVQGHDWVRNPIDAFVLAKLEAAGLRPVAPATREQLIRRVTLDLTGLPPTPEEIDAFLSDQAPNAWEKVIDRLLASPRYGERWGRHWLDLARFAESNGYEHDEIRPDAWRYRDYVIRSFNANKPYDRFIREQLAGDECHPDEADALIATGFNLLGPDMTDTSDQAQRRQDRLDDMTETAGLAFLGMTIGCARCHDHKFEPIPQSDFYRLEAFFTPAVFRPDLAIADAGQRAAYEQALRDYEALVRPTRAALAQLEEPYRKRLREARLAKIADEARVAHLTPEAQRTAAQKELVATTERLLGVTPQAIVAALSKDDHARHDELQEQLRRFDDQRPRPLPVTLGLQDNPAPPKTFVLDRGQLSLRGHEVQPGFPIILAAGHRAMPAPVQPVARSTGRRSALANWVASADNPLTARVLVNRLWQHHFGRGIVSTANDFGLRGERPTHPELLDWLATEFVAGGWDVKRMHRLMLLSATYQQSCRPFDAAREHDPDNALFSHMNRQRLEGEIVRDSLLAVSGRLNDRMGGPGVFPPIPMETLQGSAGWKASPDPLDHARRSIYVFARRNLRFPFLEAFDLPDSNLSCPKRERSTTAPQALSLLNGQDVHDAATALAARLSLAAGSADERIARAYRIALGRRPTSEELALSHEFLADAPLSEFCRALFNLNEFVYTD